MEVLTVGSIPFNIDLSCWENDYFLAPQDTPSSSHHSPPSAQESTISPFSGKWYLETKIQVLGMLTAAGVLLFRDLLSR